MKTRILFLTLFTSISVLLIAQGFAFAEIITGCLQKSTGKIYNAQIGAEQPTLPCSLFDEEISWSEEGPAGADGADGQDGVDGQDGIDGEPGPAGPPGAPQFILKDKNGKQVGTVVTVNDDWESFIVGPPGAGVLVKTNRSVLTAIDFQKADTTTATVAISVDRLNIRFQHRLLFENFGCEGSPLTKEFIVDVDFPPAFTMPAVVVGVPVPGQPNERKLYVQTDEAEIPLTRDHNSLLIGSDCIDRPDGDPIIVPSVSLELIDDKLHQTFPGPYTLEGPAAMGAPKGQLIVAAGVVTQAGVINFSQTDNFISMRIAQGRYLIEVDANLQCFHNGATQTAIGVRLITSHSPGRYVSTTLFPVASDVTGVCNQTAVYIIQLWDRMLNIPDDGFFSFQITGRKDL